MENFKLKNYIETKDIKYKELINEESLTFKVMKDLDTYLNEYLEDNVQTTDSRLVNTEHVVIKGNVHIGDGTKIDSFSTIEGPSIIGNNVEIGTNVHIRPYTIIGDNVKVGHGSEIKHSIILDNAKVASLAFVGDSIIGNNARVATGVVTSNRRFDQKSVKVYKDGNKYDLERDFFGLVLGDNSRLGANVTTYPGTHIGKNTFICPGLTVRDFIESNQIIKE